jgi:hypothetical protein
VAARPALVGAIDRAGGGPGLVIAWKPRACMAGVPTPETIPVTALCTGRLPFHQPRRVATPVRFPFVTRS